MRFSAAADDRAGSDGETLAALLPGFEAERMAVDAYLGSLLKDEEKS